MIVKPFKGLRPRREMVTEIAVKPYDVVDEEEVRETVAEHPYSFFRVTRPEVNFEEKVDTQSEEVLKSARKALEELMESGYMIQDEEDYLYVYRLEYKGHVQTGLVATFSVDEYVQGKIKKHELTREKKEDERAKHVYYVRAHTGPVYLTYKSDPEVNKTFEDVDGDPEYDFVFEDVRHTFYVIKDKEKISEIVKAFERIDSLYIADGHHRAAAAARARNWFKEENESHSGNEEYNFFLAVVFPHDKLKVYEYNRVVKDLRGMTDEEFLEKLSEKFEVKEAYRKPYRPERVHEFGVYLGDGKWYVLTPKTVEEKDPVRSLDVSILQDEILSPILGIGNPRTDPRIDFVPAVNGLGELVKYVDEKGWKVGFALHPTPLEAIMKIADEGKVVPPKSTWFHPKLHSGLVVHLI